MIIVVAAKVFADLTFSTDHVSQQRRIVPLLH